MIFWGEKTFLYNFSVAWASRPYYLVSIMASNNHNNTTKTASDPIDVRIGRRLKLRRTMLGVSQHELADMIDVTFQQIQKYENGANRISASRLYRLCRALGVPVSFFFEGVDDDADGDADFPNALTPARKRELLAFIRSINKIDDPPLRTLVISLVRQMAEGREPKDGN